MVECSRAKYRHGGVKYSEVEPSGAMVECSRVKYSHIEPW